MIASNSTKVVVEATIIRADGTREVLGIIAQTIDENITITDLEEGGN